MSQSKVKFYNTMDQNFNVIGTFKKQQGKIPKS